jgi:DNA adenine methylase
VLLRKQRCYAEVYNDLDAEIVNLFRVVRDRGDELTKALYLTPFARDEFRETYRPSKDPVEQARRTIARSRMGFGSAAACGAQTGFRSNSSRSGTTPAIDWSHYPDCLAPIIERLRGVVIENKEATEVMLTHDSPETLHYVDPTYVHSTRKLRNPYCKKAYRFEMTDEQHRELASFLGGLKGMVVLSGYHSPLYDELYAGWERIEKTGPFADGARQRTEVLWMHNIQPDLFTQAPPFLSKS